MEGYQQRVIEEKSELEERRARLEAFFSTPAFEIQDSSMQTLMKNQAVVMARYSGILGQRIAGFKSERSKEMANVVFNSAKLSEAIPEQDMEYDEEAESFMCYVTCPHCSERHRVPFQRIVECPHCGSFFKVSTP